VEKTKVAIVGMGTVGTGVARLLYDYGDRTARHAGRALWLQAVVVRDLKKRREVALPADLLTDDLHRVTDDPQIVAVAHLVGGLEPARTILLRLLEAGKDVVTANKALLAEHGPELFDRARELGRSIAFEASVAGGVPIIANISQCLSGNEITSLVAILNGTSNFILTEMEERGCEYADAVREAQRRGYAEADPTLDVDGSDAAQKLAILAHLAFGARVPWREIPRRGIDALVRDDLRFARELGYRVKLLAVAELVPEGLEVHVSPTLVRIGTPLAEVRGVFNAVLVTGDAVGPLFFQGLGAGQMPTASAVVADLIDTVVGRTAITFRSLELWSQRAPRVTPSDHGNVRARYYLRFNVDDRPGVMAEITGVLGRHGVSIASVIQHESPDAPRNIVPLVIMTHRTTEGAVTRSVAEIDRLASVRAPSVRMRVRE
jgi:homoserine dehydrogenase